MTKFLEGRYITPRATEPLTCGTCEQPIAAGEIYACLPCPDCGHEDFLTEHLDCSYAGIYVSETLTGQAVVDDDIPQLLHDARARPILLEHFPGVAARLGITANN